MNGEIRYLDTRCGTCDHPHNFAGCKACNAAGRECLGWTNHPDDIAHAEQREMEELAITGGCGILDVQMVDGILAMLVSVEEQTYAESPRQLDVSLLAVRVGPVFERKFNAEEILLQVSRIPLPDDFWKPDIEMVTRLNVLAQQWAIVQPENDTRGWAIEAYGKIKGGDKQLPVSDAHLVVGADLDGRVYTVARTLHNNNVESEYYVPRAWSRIIRGELDSLGDTAIEQVEADGLTVPHIIAMRLCYVTRHEMQAAAASERPSS